MSKEYMQDREVFIEAEQKSEFKFKISPNFRNEDDVAGKVVGRVNGGTCMHAVLSCEFIII